MPAPPRLFDRDLHRRRLDRAARRFAAARFLKDRSTADLVDRLNSIVREFPLAVDLGARDGSFARALAGDAARARVGLLIEADLSEEMLQGRSEVRLQLDEERLPFADQSLDLVVSSLALHWVNDLPGVLIQIRRALKPNGLFLGSMLGGETLSELRTALTEAEAELSGGASARISPFLDGSDGVRLLQRAGFVLPVADVDRVTARYPHPLRLIEDLRAMGEAAAFADRAGPGLTRGVIARASEIYAERYSAPDRRLTATFEIITLTGWAPP
jgi:SAM-dependent methyltransferase